MTYQWGWQDPNSALVKWGKSLGSVTRLRNCAWPLVTHVARNRLLAEPGTFALGVGENGVIKGMSGEEFLAPHSWARVSVQHDLVLLRGRVRKQRQTHRCCFKKILLFCRKNKTSSFTHGRNTWRFLFLFMSMTNNTYIKCLLLLLLKKPFPLPPPSPNLANQTRQM